MSTNCIATDLEKRFKGKPALESVTATFDPEKITVILGPSGSGKTTLLRCISGLEHADKGTLHLGDRLVYDAAKGVNVPPHQRGIGMVFQSYGLWPHMTVGKNIGFPLKVKGLAATDLRRKVDWALEMVGLSGYGARLPSQLSGGEQQRVALARAFAAEPNVLLMDEPLSNLDAMLRETVRMELQDLQRRLSITMIYITHDQEEALALADDLIVMRQGGIAQRGRPRDVYREPHDEFVARFLGSANLLPATVRRVEHGRAELDVPGLACSVWARAGHGLADHGDAYLMVRPEDVVVADDGASFFARGTVRQCMFRGNRTSLVVQIAPDVVLQAELPDAATVESNKPVVLSLKSTDAALAIAAKAC